MTRLEPMLIRVPPDLAAALRDLARETRIHQADLQREAIADLLRKHGRHPELVDVAEGDTRGAA